MATTYEQLIADKKVGDVFTDIDQTTYTVVKYNDVMLVEVRTQPGFGSEYEGVGVIIPKEWA